MTKCPDCRAVFEGLTKRSPACGYQFAADPRANVATRCRPLAPAQIWMLAAVGTVTLGIVLTSKTPSANTTGTPGRDAFGNAAQSASARAGTASRTPVSIGGTVIVKPGFWFFEQRRTLTGK